MPLLTFAPEVGPSPGTSTRTQTRLYEAEFGDGYSQAVPAGLNHIRREISLQWDGLTEAQKVYIDDFFRQHGGYQTFLYQPTGYTAPVKWTCKEWSFSAGAPWKASAKLVESFYVGP